MRKLATIRQVSEIRPIEGADAIETAVVDGWTCVVKKGEFKVGHLGVYFEIDSFLDHSKPEFAFLAPRAIKWNGLEGARIKTMKLKGQLSQGLLLPLDVIYDRREGRQASESLGEYVAYEMAIQWSTVEELNERLDLDTILGVVKWEKLLPANLSGVARGNFPSFLQKTDQERVQNISNLFEEYGEEDFQVTQKLDGSSMTAYVITKESEHFTGEEGQEVMEGVCSRNLDLVDTEGNAFWKTAKEHSLHEKLLAVCKMLGFKAIAIQGEMVGRGIQENHEKVETEQNEFYAFDIFDIDTQSYLDPLTTENVCKDMGIPHVPVHHSAIRLNEYATDRWQIIEKADGPSIRNPVGEGKVFKIVKKGDPFSFKAIGSKYLLKTGN